MGRLSDGQLSEDQLNAICVIERTCSVLSLLGCVFIIVTFCSSAAFRKPINRIVFYASLGNMLANVGTIMSVSYLHRLDSFGCRLQAFLLQLFMPADAFWTLSMAVNVYLTFYHRFDAQRLRNMELCYLLGCYGIPSVPALAFLFARNKLGQRIYGNATLWCWISTDYDVLRVATFYGPVWVVILVTLSIYVRAGRTIYQKRRQLYALQSSDLDPVRVEGEAGVAVGEEATAAPEAAAESASRPVPVRRLASFSGGDSQSANSACPVRTSSPGSSAVPDEQLVPPVPDGTVRHAGTAQGAPHRVSRSARRRVHELNNAASSYAKCALLFFTAILITWIPSSANRAYSVAHQGDVLVPLLYMSAFVLPLQGFWNAIIYAVMSWGACKSWLRDCRPSRMRAVSGVVGGIPAGEGGSKHGRNKAQFKTSTVGQRL
ncbi:G-protein coupled receptor [Metarhizium album ARSEF 1941]|uniref:G-protein coupled receptor n=1 Tax=Metarhizium album (strain ARSEF 1941) TaxID=1081103 RepID=A0A0B2X8F3_METAS|nr:G-protein coupled receptor [Metarhizium album ARSEF 1941]KHO02063.1 G-protein coupled receptor [Metarhizium album ARSEF 1941]